MQWWSLAWCTTQSLSERGNCGSDRVDNKETQLGVNKKRGGGKKERGLDSLRMWIKPRGRGGSA